MPNIAQHQSAQTIKLLLIGDPGSGKTGALPSLAAAGYNLRIMDLDNGLDIVRHLLTTQGSPYPKEAASRVDYVTLTDEMKNVSGRLIQVKAEVWQKAAGLLAEWIDPITKVNLGPISSWGPEEVLVIDSLSRLSDAAMDFQLMMNGRLGGKREQSDWYMAQGLVENMLRMLYDGGVKCNVIVICHITYIENASGVIKGYPNSLGKALPPKIGSYFNSMLQAFTKGTGKTAKHVISTQVNGFVELKTSAPLSVAAEYPVETGLADYFKTVKGGWVPSGKPPEPYKPPAKVVPLVQPKPISVPASATPVVPK